MRFEDIPQFPRATYEVDIAWMYLERQLADYAKQGLDLDPDFQRGHVWSLQQQVTFIEHMLRGGKSPRNIYFNCEDWRSFNKPIQLIDGKQRIEAVRNFMADKLLVFHGWSCSDLGKMHSMEPSFRFHVHELATRADVLRWYLAMNSGGSVHTKGELARVRKLLDDELQQEGRGYE